MTLTAQPTTATGARAPRRRPGRRGQALRRGHRRRRDQPAHPPRRGGRPARPERGRQDDHGRHAARPVRSPPRARSRCTGGAPQDAVALGLVSAVMQTGGLLKDYTVEETVRLTAVLFGKPRSAVDEALERAGIADIGKRLVGKCSGGQQQRLRFAMALLPDPELLILDEPTTGMDVGGRHDFWTAIRRGRARRPHGHLRHPLPGGGRRVRRPGGVRAPRPDRRRRHRRRGQGAGRRAARCGPPCPAPTRRRWRAMPGVESAEVRGDTVYLHGARHRCDRPAPADRHRRPGPGDHLPEPGGGVPDPDRRRRDGSDDDDRHRRCPAPQRCRGSAVSRLGMIRLELRRMMRNRRTVIFTFVMPAVFFLLFGTNADYRTERRRRRQRHRLHPGQHGGVRRDAGHHQRRGDGVDRAGRRVEPAAAADPAAAGRVRRGQARPRDDHRRGVGGRGVRRRRVRRRGAARRRRGSSAACWPGCARWCSPRSACSWATCCPART